MGFGGLFGGGGPSNAAINVQSDAQKVQAAEQTLQQQQLTANAAATATRPVIAAKVAQNFLQSTTPAGAAASSALGILNFIKTSPEGLTNQPKTGRLTLLGN